MINNGHLLKEVIQFKYNGGSNPGMVHVVFVAEIVEVGGNIKGWDFVRRDYRTFNPGLMIDVQILKDGVRRIDTSGLPSTISVGNIVDGQRQDGLLPYVTRTGDIVSVPESLLVGSSFNSNGYDNLTINKGPESITIRICGNSKVTVNDDGVTPEELLKELQAVLA